MGSNTNIIGHDLNSLCVKDSDSIHSTISVIDKGAMQIALVINSSNKFVGTVTDGDIRRAILRGLHFSEPIGAIVNKTPLTVKEDCEVEYALKLMQQRKLHHLPIISRQGELIGLHTEKSSFLMGELPNVAVIMAGGLGERLRPLTKKTPKPMLPIGGKPILETILLSLRDYGFRRIVISVNYLKTKIRKHFGNGSRFGLMIEYLNEEERSGTAGSLRALCNVGNYPCLVINGDVLTRVNYRALLNYHLNSNAYATMCVRVHTVTIPYGVVTTEGNRICSIEEKPETKFFINSGIYVLNPQTIKMIPKNGIFDMPELFRLLNQSQKTVVAFPIREYWKDIGHIDDYQQANTEFKTHFAVYD